MYQIRARPKDQSSDEDDNEDKQQSVTSLQSDLQKDIDPQSVSNDIGNLKHSEDENNNVSSVHSNGNDDDEKFVDFSMFQSKENECGGNDNKNGIATHCDALQRLGKALRAYDVLNSMEQGIYNGDDDEMEPEIPTFSEFIGSEHRVQFLEDFNHFMTEHQYFGEEIKEEMIERYALKRCNAVGCELTMRHFGGRRAESQSASKEENVRSKFYRQKFDSLHFHLFHLEESGYRYRSKVKQNGTEDVVDEVESEVQCELDEEMTVDRDLAEAVSSINDNKKKCDFGRFVGDGPNKYTLNVSGIYSAHFGVIFVVHTVNPSNSSISVKTWMERLFEYVKSRSIPQSVINKAKIWILNGAFDSDAVQEDANEAAVQNNQSSICSHVDHQALSKSIADFVEMTKGTSSLNAYSQSRCPLFVDGVCCLNVFSANIQCRTAVHLLGKM